MKKLVVTLAIAVGAVIAPLNTAAATPGPNPYLDHLCLNPAYAAMHQECAEAADPRDYSD